jgi:threonine transporter
LARQNVPWRKSDTTWTLGLFGTAIGAGVLFFPFAQALAA